jgi:N-acetyl-anhydromuramyl-L-alanine amidase AmpD
MNKMFKIIKILEEYYPIEHVVGHSEIARKEIDPGPAFRQCTKWKNPQWKNLYKIYYTFNSTAWAVSEFFKNNN